MRRYMIASGMIVAGLLALGGCPQVAPSSNETVQAVSEAAAAVADQIGVPGGYGGQWMQGYRGRMPMHMGFLGLADLAEPGAVMTVTVYNQTDQQATIYLMYMSSPLGLGMQVAEVTVQSQSQQDVELPCSEMVGAGLLDQPGSVGCLLGDGRSIGNRMATPGFLGIDYECGGTFEFFLAADADDLDADGDTSEVLLTSSALRDYAGWGPGWMGGGHMRGGPGKRW